MTIAGHTDYVRALCYTNNGRAIISGGKDGTVRILETTSGEPTMVVSVFSISLSFTVLSDRGV